jgi:probable phosphoglycerate mutase
LTNIFLIRHAEAEGNIYRRANGHYNGLITERGYKQIERLRTRFEDIQIDAIYSSDLSRARDTAEALSEPRGLEINLTEMLREVNMGVWEDVAWGEIEYSYPDMNDKFGSNPELWSVDGGESYEHIKARMSNFLREAAKRHDGGSIAVFSHGFAIRSLMCLLEGIPSHEIIKMPYFDNSSVTHLTFDNGKFDVVHRGCISHLDKELSTMAHQSWWQAELKRINENLRFIKLNEVASENLLRIFKAKAGERANVDMQYAAFLVDEPIGIVGLDTKKDSKSGIGWISYIHVVPNHRNKKFATQLLGLAVSDFRKLKRTRLRIEIPSGSLGINFMSKCGFQSIDVSDEMCLMEKHIKNW